MTSASSPDSKRLLGRQLPDPVRDVARLLPGGGLAGLVALAATAVSLMHGGPLLLYALFFGLALNYLSQDERTRSGLDFCARTLLRVGVGLMGARITAEQIVGLGPVTVAVVVSAMAATIGMGLLLARRCGLSRSQGLLTGGSVAICGASAALALSAVLPRRHDSERFTLLVVVAVTTLSTVAMVVYPLVANWLALPPQLAGLFIGGTIHDVAQVAGAGYLLGPDTGDIAIIVKLLRVAMLTAVVFAVVLAVRHSHTSDCDQASPTARPPLVPWFLWLFIAAVALNSAGLLHAGLQAGVSDLSRVCLIVAIAALGLKTSFKELARSGWAPLALILVETVWLALLVLGYILFTLR